MATLQKIRSKGPLIAIVIGIALFAFILGDLIQNGSSFFGNSQFTVAKINGKELSYQEYQARIYEVEEYYKMRTGQTLSEDVSEQIRTSVWEMIVREYTLAENLEKIGIGVSSDELFDMVQGNNVDPQIKQAFVNQETGVFDPALVMQFLKQMEEDQTGQSKAIWLYIENEIRENRFYNKYYALVQKGLFVTTEEAKSENFERNYIVDMKIASKTYNTISDSTISVTDAELKSYYKKHQKEYEQEETRDIAYITFDIVPSSEDSIATYNQIKSLYKDFTEISKDDLERFVNLNSDNPYEIQQYKKGDKSNEKMDNIIAESDIGSVYGPYLEDGAYKLMKLMGQDTIEEVNARHILISKDKENIERGNKIADSLIKVIKKGGDFTELAAKFSDDPGSKNKGGDLGWFGEGVMVTPFNDACFNGKVGDIVKVETDFGVHVIEILGKEAPQTYVTIDMEIIPSQKTYQKFYSKASEFAGINRTQEQFDAAVEENKYTKKVAPSLTQATTVIAGLENPRELIRWAYQVEKGDVSDVFELGDRYVVAIVTETREKGIAPFEQVKEQVELAVKKEKKAEQIISELSSQTFTDIDAVAEHFGSNVNPVNSVSFNSYSIAGAGYEPNILAKAVSVEKDVLVGPIKGENGVYYFTITSITPPQEEDIDWTTNTEKLTTTLQSRANYQAFEALKKAADIEDNRAKFF